MTIPANLPPLREELTIREGPRLHDGQPSWTLQDPARNRFFRLDWLTFEILQRWSLARPDLIAQSIAQQTPLVPNGADVLAVLKFALAHQLLKFAGGTSAIALAAQQQQARPSWWLWLVHNYLFFRVPLVRPEPLLKRAVRLCAPLFTPRFWQLTALAAFVGFFLLARQWDGFKANWFDLVDLHGLLGFAAVLVAVKIAHEFGHGVAATWHGCRVPTMGIAFLVMTPVAYTDTNDAWNLVARRPRLLIGAAGMLAEIAIAAWATLAWGLLPDGFLRDAALLLATVTWVKSLVVNTSPVMRFDGYYLLSDWLDLPNLHTRSFALARWWLREKLFNLREDPPESFRPTLRRGLVALAIFIWLYRLVVFVGIAIFVYHFFFKLLGIVLFAVEIAWFVVIPIYSEMKVWFNKRASILRSRRIRFVGGALILLLALVCVPLPQRIRLSAEFYPGQEFNIVASESGRLAEFSLIDGSRVEAGAELLAIESEPLIARERMARARESRLQAEIAAAASDEAMRARVPVMRAALATAQAARVEAEVSRANLKPRAPFAGTFRIGPAADLRAGDWVARHEHLGTVVGDEPWVAVAYLDEQFAHLLNEGDSARFFPAGIAEFPVDMTVVSIERDASRVLAHPVLAVSAGGSVPAQLVDDELVPERAVYRITLRVNSVSSQVADRVRRGGLVLNAGAEPLIARFFRSTMSVLWRELGF